MDGGTDEEYQSDLSFYSHSGRSNTSSECGDRTGWSDRQQHPGSRLPAHHQHDRPVAEQPRQVQVDHDQERGHISLRNSRIRLGIVLRNLRSHYHEEVMVGPS